MRRDHTLPEHYERWDTGMWPACEFPERQTDPSCAFFVACDYCAMKAELELRCSSPEHLSQPCDDGTLTLAELLIRYLEVRERLHAA